ncbi:hypothetical protein Pyn_10232 [Prunus yedoensis var. nudiflora]|uniref:Uncharacterized protein n=1 Tax=Prunus yedoensis var. nudiflora TaxID=2094558 RepID=A0A314UQX5_PRUYE|nr:hypothetical protein Pyn_10232 [Prunus yedoensis var. nudiflora]
MILSSQDEVAIVEMTTVEVSVTEAVVTEMPDVEAADAEPSLVVLAGPPPVGATVAPLAPTVPIEPSPVVPRRPSGIVIQSISLYVSASVHGRRSVEHANCFDCSDSGAVGRG